MFASDSIVHLAVSLAQVLTIAVIGLMALGADALAPALRSLSTPVGVLAIGLILTGAFCLAALAAVSEVAHNG